MPAPRLDALPDAQPTVSITQGNHLNPVTTRCYAALTSKCTINQTT